jgi:hypothetical protein
MFGSGYENCPEFGVLGGVIFKLTINAPEPFGSVSLLGDSHAWNEIYK